MMRIWSIVLLMVMLLASGTAEGQNRQRARNKTKTTALSKKSTSKNQSPKTSAEAKKKQAETQKEIKLTEAQIRENEAKVSKSLADLGKIDIEIGNTTAKIKEINKTLNRLNGEIGNLENNIAKNEAQLTRLREEYLKAVKKMRKSKKNNSTLAFIFSSKSLNQAMRRMRYLREFSLWRQRQTDEINDKIEILNSEKVALANAREEQKNALALQKTSETQLALQHKKQEALVNELKQNGKALDSHLKKKQAEARELGNIVSQLIAEEQRKAAEEARRKAEEEARQKALEEERRKAEQERLLAQEEERAKAEVSKDKSQEKNKKTKKTEQPAKVSKDRKPAEYADARKRAPRSNKETENVKPETGSRGFEGMRGKLPLPVNGRFSITSRFGRQSLPDLPGVEYDNPGIDAETDAGANACVVFKGKVSGVYLLPGYNTVVIVNHGNYYTVYGNIATPSVKTGDSVNEGTALGTLALNDEDTSHSSIHFEVWKNREKLNPQEWLK